MTQIGATLLALAERAIFAQHGQRLVAQLSTLTRPTRVWSIGKAACAMARGAAERFGEPLTGLLITKQGHAQNPPAGLMVFEAGHPISDSAGQIAARALLEDAAGLDDSDRVLLLLSGGASALLAEPISGVSLAQWTQIGSDLVLSGASIVEINCVRRHLGAALGGRLAESTRASIEALVISDVLDDDPSVIGSGPVSPDGTTVADARAILKRLGVSLPPLAETPKPEDPCFSRVRYRVIASPRTLREAAAEQVTAVGFVPVVFEPLLKGDVADVCADLLARSRSLAFGEVLVAAGEPTLRVHGRAGRGGRAQHLALLASKALTGQPRTLIAIGSDGTDGPTDAAGAVVDGETWTHALAVGKDPQVALDQFDSYSLLDDLGALIRIGPTGTNCTDLYLLAPR